MPRNDSLASPRPGRPTRVHFQIADRISNRKEEIFSYFFSFLLCPFVLCLNIRRTPPKSELIFELDDQVTQLDISLTIPWPFSSFSSPSFLPFFNIASEHLSPPFFMDKKSRLVVRRESDDRDQVVRTTRILGVVCNRGSKGGPAHFIPYYYSLSNGLIHFPRPTFSIHLMVGRDWTFVYLSSQLGLLSTHTHRRRRRRRRSCCVLKVRPGLFPDM